MEQKKTENTKKREQAEMLADNGKKLESAVFQVNQEIKVLEGNLQNLRNKHEFSVNELSNNIRRLEQDNQNLVKIKGDLDKTHLDKSNESRNLNFNLK